MNATQTDAGAAAIDKIAARQLLAKADDMELRLRSVIAYNLARIREKLGLRQVQLVEGIPGVSPGPSARATGYKLENGRSTLTTHRMCMLAARLECTYDDLVREPTSAAGRAEVERILARLKEGDSPSPQRRKSTRKT